MPSSKNSKKLPTHDLYHSVQFYETDDFINTRIINFLGPNLQQHDAAIMIAADEHIKYITSEMEKWNINVASRKRNKQLTLLNAGHMLKNCTSNGILNNLKLNEIIEELLKKITKKYQSIRIYGELVSELSALTDFEAVIEVEKMWNKLIKKYPIKLLCGYPLVHFNNRDNTKVFNEICEAHNHLDEIEGLGKINCTLKQKRHIISLQQQSKVLATTMATSRLIEIELKKTLSLCNNFFRTLLEKNVIPLDKKSAPIGVWSWDLKKDIIFWNNSLNFLFGMNYGRFGGSYANVLGLIYYKDRKKFDDNVQYALKHHQTYFNEFRIVHSDGSLHHLAASGHIFRRNGKVLRLEGICIDITHRKMAENFIRLSIDKAAQLMKEAKLGDIAKQNFLKRVNHELQTPLNAIIGFTGILLMKLPGPLNMEQEKQLRIVNTHAQKLLIIIKQILSVTDIENGKFEMQWDKVDCQDIIKDIIKTLKPLADEKKLRIKTHLPSHRIAIETEKHALSQILLNLISNAINFTTDGSVEIRLKKIAPKKKPFVKIDIIDTGKGIRNKEKLFELFEKPAKPGLEEGMGLGLFLTAKLIRLINAKLELETKPHHGSTFSILIPVRKGIVIEN